MKGIDESVLRILQLQRPDYRGLDQKAAGARLEGKISALADEAATWLPPDTGKVLDIGAGLGFATLALNRLIPGASFCLLDRDEIAANGKYSFSQQPEGYTDFGVASRFLNANGVENFELVDEREGFPDRIFDIVISIRSWGWHYPVLHYLPQVMAATKAGAFLRIDLRQAEFDGGTLPEAGWNLIWREPARKGWATLWKRR